MIHYDPSDYGQEPPPPEPTWFDWLISALTLAALIGVLATCAP